MSGRRLHSIITTVNRDGQWSGTVGGWRVQIEKCPCEASGHLIHWGARRTGESLGGWARTVKDAVEFCEREFRHVA